MQCSVIPICTRERFHIDVELQSLSRNFSQGDGFRCQKLNASSSLIGFIFSVKAGVSYNVLLTFEVVGVSPGYLWATVDPDICPLFSQRDLSRKLQKQTIL